MLDGGVGARLQFAPMSSDGHVRHTKSVVEFYRAMRREYAARTAFGLTVAYLVRKVPSYTFHQAEHALKALLEHHHDERK